MFYRHRAYHYTNKKGKLVYVPECYVWHPRTQTKARSMNSRCPECGAKILTMRGKRGGWAHFDFGLKSYNVLHSCFTKGRDLSKKRPDEMDDLFDGISAPDTSSDGQKDQNE